MKLTLILISAASMLAPFPLFAQNPHALPQEAIQPKKLQETGTPQGPQPMPVLDLVLSALIAGRRECASKVPGTALTIKPSQYVTAEGICEKDGSGYKLRFTKMEVKVP